jgi:hypothetical protein
VELAVVILILVLLIAGSLAALVLLTGESGSRSLPGWAGRRLSQVNGYARPARVIDVATESTKPAFSRLELASREEVTNRLDDLTAELRAILASSDSRSGEVTALLDALHQSLRERLDQIARDTGDRWTDLTTRQAALEARQEAATERLRADLALHFATHQRQVTADRSLAERCGVAAELYALLARLEAALAAVTNPILLPGEPYAPPSDLLPDALIWDNWKDVGERTFAFADLYSARRLYLSEPTRQQVGAFVAELRGLLTEAIYPNLRPNPEPGQRERLHKALATLAIRLPAVRDAIERDFRETASVAPKNPSA